MNDAFYGNHKEKSNSIVEFNLIAQSFLLQVLMPKGRYNGQKPTRDVSTNTPPNTNRITPTVPVTVPVKYNAAKTAATTKRMILSVVPMLLFMMMLFGEYLTRVPHIIAHTSDVHHPNGRFMSMLCFCHRSVAFTA